MDLGLLFGFLGLWAVIVLALLAGGDMGIFVDTASVILVFGGTTTIAFFSLPVRSLKPLMKVWIRAFFMKQPSIEKLVKDMVSFADTARRDGILSLEGVTKDIDDPFIVRGIRMAVDGTDPELIEQIMTTELESIIERHDACKQPLEVIAKYSPAMGMIGTLIGLVIMLQNMDDPSKIGPGMAVAILTTLYGAVIANCIALPMVDRLARRNAEEVLYKTVIIKGVMAIQSGDNPRVVEQKLLTFLPPTVREAMSGQDLKAAA